MVPTIRFLDTILFPRKCWLREIVRLYRELAFLARRVLYPGYMRRWGPGRWI